MKKLLTAMTAILGLSIQAADAADRQSVRDIQPLRTLVAQKLDTSKLDSVLGLRAGVDSLKERKSYLAADGSTTVRYTQMYRGLPVLGDDVVVATLADGSFKLGYGSVLNRIADDVKSIRPALSERKVLKNAKAIAAASAAGSGRACGASAAERRPRSRRRRRPRPPPPRAARAGSTCAPPSNSPIEGEVTAHSVCYNLVTNNRKR